MNVPFVDLKTQHNQVREELDQAIKNILDNTSFILGKEVELFEEEFAKYCGAKYAAGVNNGTGALQLALLAKGIKQGDEVITTANTFIATAEAISHCNATPVFVDIEKDTYNIDSSKIEQTITKKTKAIMPVHLYGQSADMKPIMEIAEKYSLEIIEDCAQAHGAEYNGKRVPISGTGCFSFYPAKNLGAIGESGIVVSDDEKIVETVKMLRAHGEKPKNVHTVIGFNYRMEGIQAAALRVKLKHLEKWIEGRRKNAKLYNSILDKNLVTIPIEKEYARHVYHLYVIQTEKRDELRTFLDSAGIATGIHYTTPIHLQQAYSFLKKDSGSLPITEKAMERIISLPMFPELTKEQIDFVAEKIKEGIK